MNDSKMHALIFRRWRQRVKGRDWYDFEWYVRHGVALDFTHFKARALDFNGLELTEDDFRQLLRERLSTADVEQVRQDVRPFVKNAGELDLWSREYFLQLADMVSLKL